MIMDRRQALRELRRACARLPASQRAHVLARYLTCPFPAVLERIPAGSSVLDIGAGHGILALLAGAGGARRVVALEPDLRKSLRSLRHPEVRFVAGFDGAVAGRFDVVTMTDVLYKMPIAEWDGLFARVHDRLVPGGTFLLKELDPGRPLKAAWNRWQEALASAVNLTLGRAHSYENSARLAARLERTGFVEFRAHDLGRGYLHAHVLYSARRPAA